MPEKEYEVGYGRHPSTQNGKKDNVEILDAFAIAGQNRLRL
jgi:hypothetical protein